MSETILGPVEVLAQRVTGTDGTPLNSGSASASFEVWNSALTSMIVTATPMAWNPDLPDSPGWTATFDPTSLAAGTYEALVTVTPNAGPPIRQWVEYIYAPHREPGEPASEPASSQSWLLPWCTVADIPPRRLLDSNNQPIADVDMDFIIAAATNLLFTLSGRKYRAGRSVVRPCSIARGRWTSSMYPYSSMGGFGSAWGIGNAGWPWVDIGFAWWGGRDASELVLQAPVQRINDVMLNGVSLGAWTPGGDTNPNFTVYDRRRLVLGQGVGAWPLDQPIDSPISEPGTAQVDYEWGTPPPPDGKLAAVALSVELALGVSGQDACRLPARVLTIATQGVTVAAGNALEYIKEQLTGIPVVDLFLVSANPSKRRRRAVFLSPESVLGRST